MIRMKSVPAVLMTLLLSTGVFAQDASQSHAGIEGLVTRDPDSQPVKKALVELIAENQAKGGNYATLTGSDGAFRIENIMPGRYHLFAERRGLLDSSKEQGHTEGRILDLAAGQQLRDLHLRLQAAAVVHGRVTDEDGDPLPGAEVNVLRQTYVAGRPGLNAPTISANTVSRISLREASTFPSTRRPISRV
jgi:protocatechuate 3,4-dioxygenase beta subunit